MPANRQGLQATDRTYKVNVSVATYLIFRHQKLQKSFLCV